MLTNSFGLFDDHQLGNISTNILDKKEMMSSSSGQVVSVFAFYSTIQGRIQLKSTIFLLNCCRK